MGNSLTLALNYCRVQVDDTHSEMMLEFDSVLVTLTLALLIVFGSIFLGVVGNGWITLTLWRLHLHSSIAF